MNTETKSLFLSLVTVAACGLSGCVVAPDRVETTTTRESVTTVTPSARTTTVVAPATTTTVQRTTY